MLQKTISTTGERLFAKATGPIDYPLLNDYMFHIITSKNPRILTGLIAAILHMNPENITDIEIKNPFPPGQSAKDNLEFHATYKILNIKNQHLYSSKFSIHVVDLTHIELATAEDKAHEIHIWAKLFKATTWEDIKMIASDNQYIADCADALYVSNEDYVIREQCRAREEAINREKQHIKQHEDDMAALQEMATALQELMAENARLKAQLAQNNM